VLGEAIFGGKRAAAEHTAGKGGQKNRKGGGGQRPVAAHD
jgi:hypothetical protein